MPEIEVLGVQGEDISVPYGTAIKGTLTWKNLTVPPGTEVYCFFFLGEKTGETLYYTTLDGKGFFIGAMAGVPAPAIGQTVNAEIPSWALFPGAYDVYAGVARREVDISAFVAATLMHEGRMIGFGMDEFQAGYLSIYGAAWFENELTVTEPAAPAEATDFEFVAG